jgi:hypothetical protein
MLEKSVEDYLFAEVAKRGGLCIKLNPKGYKGIPDRLVILPRGQVIFVELKRPKGGIIARLQWWWLNRLWSLGVGARFAISKAEVDELLSTTRVDQQDQSAS